MVLPLLSVQKLINSFLLYTFQVAYITKIDGVLWVSKPDELINVCYNSTDTVNVLIFLHLMG